MNTHPSKYFFRFLSGVVCFLIIKSKLWNAYWYSLENFYSFTLKFAKIVGKKIPKDEKLHSLHNAERIP